MHILHDENIKGSKVFVYDVVSYCYNSSSLFIDFIIYYDHGLTREFRVRPDTTTKRSFSDTFYNDTCNKCEQKSTYPYTFRESVSIVLVLFTHFEKCKQKC